MVFEQLVDSKGRTVQGGVIPFDGGVMGKALHDAVSKDGIAGKICQKLIDMALHCPVWSVCLSTIKFIFERLEGLPARATSKNSGIHTLFIHKDPEPPYVKVEDNLKTDPEHADMHPFAAGTTKDGKAWIGVERAASDAGTLQNSNACPP